MYLFAQNRVRGYSWAVAARSGAGFGRIIMGGGPNPALTRVVTAPNWPPRYVIDTIVVRWMVGLTIARDFLYIVRSAALGDHHPVTSIEIIQLRLSSPVLNVDQNRTLRSSDNQYQDHPVTFIQSSIERIP